MLVGAHAPNYPDLTDADYGRLLALRAGVLGTLWTNGTRHRAEVYRKVLQILPDCRFVVRVGPSAITTPRQFIIDTGDALREAGDAAEAGLVSVRALNEINLRDEGAWSAEAYVAFLREVRSGWLWPSVDLVSAPLSMGLDGWQAFWDRLLDGGMLDVVDRLAVNYYPDAGQPLAPFLESGFPIDVTEYGRLSLSPGEQRGHAYADAMAGLAAHAAIGSCQFFILNGRSNGAWDERYILTDDEARVVGDRLGGNVAQPPEEVAVINGIDISNNQGAVDLAQVKAAGYEFVICKASEDPAFVDRFLPDFWRQALEQELVRGAYCFARPSESSPAESVAHFQRAVTNAGGFRAGDLYALDIEDERHDGSLHVWVAEWLDLAERVFGFGGFKYSGKWYTETRDLEHADLERWPTWWAAYQSEQPGPTVGWGPISIWQNSASAAVPGVNGNCDTDVFHGTADELRALGKPGGGEPAPDPEPDPWRQVDADLVRLTASIQALKQTVGR